MNEDGCYEVLDREHDHPGLVYLREFGERLAQVVANLTKDAPRRPGGHDEFSCFDRRVVH